MEKVLLNVKEFCAYMGIGETKARELLRDETCEYSMQIGNRWYANKRLLDMWVDRNSKRT